MNILRDRFQPSTIKLWGWDHAEFAKYTKLMSPSSGNKIGVPTEFIEMLDRKWYVSNIEWEGDLNLLYEITLKSVVELKT